MRYEGKIYRPWPEANSLLIQATPLQILVEEKYLLENLANFDTITGGIP